MKGLSILLGHSFSRARNLVLALGILLTLFQGLLILVARSIHRSGSFEQIGALLPPFVRDLIGPALAGLLSFSGIVCLGYFHPVVLISLMALTIFLATLPAGEIESGFMDLILSRPLPRRWIISRSVMVGLVCTAAPLLMMLLGTWGGLLAFAPPGTPWPSVRLLGSLVANLAFLMMCWSGITLAIATVSQRRGNAGWGTGLLALATFLLDYIARAWKPLSWFSWVSPFHYYDPLGLLLGKPLPMWHLLVLGLVGIAGIAFSYVCFERRDIAH